MMKTKLFIIVLLFSVSFVNAQNIYDVVYTKDKHIPAYFPIKEEIRLSLKLKSKSNADALKNILHLNDETTAVLIDTLTDITGGFHESYIEYYKGIKVEGTRCNIHYDKEGKPKMINGNFRTIERIDTVARFSAQEGFQQALKHAGISAGKRREYPTTEKVIYVKDDTAYLTYKYRVDSYDKDYHSWVYVDVMTGKVINTVRAVCNVTSSVTTVYSGHQTIECQYYNDIYRLRDYTRGNGIETYAFASYIQPNTYIGYDYTSTNSSWSNMSTYDRAALDVHWGVETTYDYYYNKFGRNSYDNQGSVIRSYVNNPNSNAYWTGNEMVFGEANSIPWVSLDITAHELTHAFTQSTSYLEYQAESGAINEGMSDVFATCVERYAKPNNGYNIWLIGEDVVTLRDMGNPTCKYYHGTGWIDTSNPTVNNDQGGVHTNSGVFNYWFYQLVNGTNTETYPVDSIGFEKAIQICYLMNAAYLTSNSTYSDAAQCSILAAKHLGYEDNIVEQIYNAWKNVGVNIVPNISGSSVVCGIQDYYVENLPSGANVSWDFVVNSSNPVAQMQVDTPTANKCRISRNEASYSAFSATLTATVTYQTDTIVVLTKNLYGHMPPQMGIVKITNTENGHNIPYLLTSFNGADLQPNVRYEIMCTHFPGMKIIPSAPSFVMQGLTFRPIDDYVYEVIMPQGGFLTLLVTGGGCYEFSFSLGTTSNGYLISHSNDGNMLRVTVSSNHDSPSTKADKSGSISKVNTSKHDMLNWHLEIYDMNDNRRVASASVEGNSYTLNTSPWKKGVYVIRATVDKDILIEKLYLK